jgi:hypothetical protein
MWLPVSSLNTRLNGIIPNADGNASVGQQLHDVEVSIL